MAYTDEQLYDILEENGFKKSESNLKLFKEFIDNNTIAILDYSDVNLSEGMSKEYLLMQLLDKNDFELNENNMNTLSEGMKAHHIFLKADKLTKEQKQRYKNLKKML